jgi:hypothetical protein
VSTPEYRRPVIVFPNTYLEGTLTSGSEIANYVRSGPADWLSLVNYFPAQKSLLEKTGGRLNGRTGGQNSSPAQMWAIVPASGMGAGQLNIVNKASGQYLYGAQDQQLTCGTTASVWTLSPISLGDDADRGVIQALPADQVSIQTA